MIPRITPNCQCRHCSGKAPWPIILALGAALACSLFAGCATVKADAKGVAEVCRPELLPDAVQALPLVAALAVCEVQGGDCSGPTDALEALGKTDAKVCAAAELHAATVKLAAVDAGAP